MKYLIDEEKKTITLLHDGVTLGHLWEVGEKLRSVYSDIVEWKVFAKEIQEQFDVKLGTKEINGLIVEPRQVPIKPEMPKLNNIE